MSILSMCTMISLLFSVVLSQKRVPFPHLETGDFDQLYESICLNFSEISLSKFILTDQKEVFQILLRVSVYPSSVI